MFSLAFLYISKLTLIIKNKIGYWQSKSIFYASITFLQVFQESYRIVDDVILRCDSTMTVYGLPCVFPQNVLKLGQLRIYGELCLGCSRTSGT